MRRLAVVAAAFLGGTLSVPAWAAGECPDGSWFCDTAPIPEQPPPEEAPARDVEPVDEPAPSTPPPTGAERSIRIDVERVPPPKRRARR